MTEEGANAFVQEKPRFLQFFLGNLPNICKTKIWTDDAQRIYSFIGVLFKTVSPNAVSEYIPVKTHKGLSFICARYFLMRQNRKNGP